MKPNKLVKAVLVLSASLLFNCKPIIDYPGTIEEIGIEESFERYMELIQQYKSGNAPIKNYKDSFTLEWDEGSKKIDVKYRQRFTEDWLLLGTSDINEFLVSGIEPGIYEFAVHDKELDVTHTSLEQYAQPTSGWFIMNKYSPESDLDLDQRISDAEMRLFIDKWTKKEFTDQQFSLNADFYLSQE